MSLTNVWWLLGSALFVLGLSAGILLGVLLQQVPMVFSSQKTTKSPKPQPQVRHLRLVSQVKRLDRWEE